VVPVSRAGAGNPQLDPAIKTALPNVRINRERNRLLELKDIKAIIDLMRKNDLSVFEMEKDGFRLKLQKGSGEAPVFAAPAPQMIVASAPAVGPTDPKSAAPPATSSAAAPPPGKEVTSPMVGTFYRSSAPEAPPFVDVGQEVNEDTVVCIIEAMKVMNEIKAEVSGVIAEVVAENGKPVQFGQTLFKVR
jgi:acetyl-CoA carboxylase biotin carboxyl carrier protein